LRILKLHDDCLRFDLQRFRRAKSLFCSRTAGRPIQGAFFIPCFPCGSYRDAPRRRLKGRGDAPLTISETPLFRKPSVKYALEVSTVYSDSNSVPHPFFRFSGEFDLKNPDGMICSLFSTFVARSFFGGGFKLPHALCKGIQCPVYVLK